MIATRVGIVDAIQESLFDFRIREDVIWVCRIEWTQWIARITERGAEPVERVDLDEVLASGGQQQVDQTRIGRFKGVIVLGQAIVVSNQMTTRVVDSNNRVDIVIRCQHTVHAETCHRIGKHINIDHFARTACKGIPIAVAAIGRRINTDLSNRGRNLDIEVFLLILASAKCIWDRQRDRIQRCCCRQRIVPSQAGYRRLSRVAAGEC